jgi:hypothetical protein
MTLFWSAQIECSFVSTLWHHPNLLGLARHELDFESHITIRAYRKILQAISVVYGDLGANLDFPTVVQCITEDMHAFEECGGLLGLDQVFTDGTYYPEGRLRPEPIIREYIRLLREYAIARGTDPLQAIKHYTRGRGHLQRNKLATKPTHPSVVGKIERCCCGRRCLISGWPAGERDTLNLTFTPER